MRFKSINLSNRLCGWNGVCSSRSILSIWPFCKLKSVNLPTRRDVIERWLAKRLCICHKKSHKREHLERLDWAQCASFSFKVTMYNVKINYQSFSERYLLSLSFAYTKCVCAHMERTGHEKFSNKPPPSLPLSFNHPFCRWRHLCPLFRALARPSIFAKATSIIRKRWVSASAACVPSDSLLSYLVLAAEDISPAFPTRCCSTLLCWPCCATALGWGGLVEHKTDGDHERDT